jgi:hypothetical protein
MKDRSAELMRRDAIERHIAQGTSRIERLRDLIVDTARRGDDTQHAQRLLATLEHSLSQLCDLRATQQRLLDAKRRRGR